jgi:hypothetical protein
MYLVQLLLPVQSEKGQPFERALFKRLEQELTDRFGGLTAYTCAPATGLWEEQPGHTVREQVVVYEVMADNLEPEWWATLRQRLEAQFAQDELVVRAQEIQRL